MVAVEPRKCGRAFGRPAKNHIIRDRRRFIPKILNRAVIDEIATVSERRRRHRELAPAGPGRGDLGRNPSGAALTAALSRGRADGPSSRASSWSVVCDTGERYASTPLMSALIRGG